MESMQPDAVIVNRRKDYSEDQLQRIEEKLDEILEWKAEVDTVLTDFVSRLGSGGLVSMLGGIIRGK